MTGAARAAPPRRRGQPLAILALVLVGWTAARVALWEAPYLPGGPRVTAPVHLVQGRAPLAALSPAGAPAPRETGIQPASADPQPFPAMAGARPQPIPVAPWLPLAAPAAVPPPLAPANVVAGHQLMMLAALGRLTLPPLLALGPAQPPPARLATPASGLDVARAPLPATLSRWSGDGWVLLRQDGSARPAAPAFARYGASQAGGVLRYSLAPASPLRPQAYLRLTRALGGFDESEAAAGLALRPVPGLPVRLLGEGRVQRSLGRTRLRPAASLVSEIPPLRLPLGGEGEVYAQAGYVGGKDATPFFDAAASAERAVARAGRAELRLGAGAWAGGQEGATRLDLGPRASLRLRLGPAPSRLAFDWRFRVAGNAAPGSGPALTFSAGF